MTGPFEARRLARSCVEVAPDLWIGGCRAPLPDGVRLVVTVDWHAGAVKKPGVRELRDVFPDSHVQPVPHERIHRLVAAVAAEDGGVLVRCQRGLNRSALVAALALRARGLDAAVAVEQIRAVRPGALNNPYFADLVVAWPDDPMARRR